MIGSVLSSIVFASAVQAQVLPHLRVSSFHSLAAASHLPPHQVVPRSIRPLRPVRRRSSVSIERPRAEIAAAPDAKNLVTMHKITEKAEARLNRCTEATANGFGASLSMRLEGWKDGDCISVGYEKVIIDYKSGDVLYYMQRPEWEDAKIADSRFVAFLRTEIVPRMFQPPRIPPELRRVLESIVDKSRASTEDTQRFVYSSTAVGLIGFLVGSGVSLVMFRRSSRLEYRPMLAA